MNEEPTAAANRSYSLAPGEGERLDVVGSTTRVLAGGRESRGGVFLFELTAPPDNGPPLHTYRDEDELFFLIEGHARFVVDGTEFTLGPGGFAYAARGSVHTWEGDRAVARQDPDPLHARRRARARVPRDRRVDPLGPGHAAPAHQHLREPGRPARGAAAVSIRRAARVRAESEMRHDPSCRVREGRGYLRASPGAGPPEGP